MFCCLPVVYVLGCVLVREGNKNRQIFYRYVRTCRVRPHAENPRNRLIYSQQKNYFERLPRELQCSDGAQTSTNVSGRASRVGVLDILPKSARTKRYFRNKTIISQLYNMHIRLSFGEWDVSRGVTQAGMPQGKVINRHPAVLVA